MATDPLKEATFVPLDELKREGLDNKEQAMRQMVIYVARHRNVSVPEAQVLVDRAMAVYGDRDKTQCTIYHRPYGNDKYEETIPLKDFKERIIGNNLVLTPSHTAYISADIKKSWLGEYVNTKLSIRKELRKEVYLAKAAGNTALANRKNAGQIRVKTQANIISGTSLSQGSAIFNPTIHSSLTSITRVVTSTCNGNLERYISGAYNFQTISITIGYYTSIIEDLQGKEAAWEAVIAKYNMVIPTVDVLLKQIRTSTDRYFVWSTLSSNAIVPFLNGLTPLERAACLYSGNLYEIRMNNPEIVRGLLDRCIEKHHAPEPIDNVVELVNGMAPTVMMAVHHRFYNEIRGLGVNYPDYPVQVLSDMYVTAVNMNNALLEYADFLKVVMLTPIHPPTVYDFKTAVRDNVIMSDTDSAVSFLQEWVKWYQGDYRIHESSLTVANVLTLLTTLNLQWYLRLLMVNMGVAKEEILNDRLSMKPEFTMPVFLLMSVSKHYAAGSLVENGNVFDELDVTIKGGSLKSSSVPLHIRQICESMATGIMQDMIDIGEVSILKYIDMVAKAELEVYLSIHRGSTDYLRTISVDAAETYKIKDPSKNKYHWCLYWNTIYAESTGHTALTPYTSVKIPVKMKGKTRLAEWVDAMEEPFKSLTQKWITAHQKTTIETIYIPLEYAVSYGLPKELHSVLDSKRIVLDLCKMLYIVLESLAYYKRGDADTVLEALGYPLDYDVLKELDRDKPINGYVWENSRHPATVL